MVSLSTSAGGRLGRNLTYGLSEVLGEAIVTGRYDEVRFPTEAELSAEYGVSRSVTREAVKMLASKGLLSARPRHGTVVEPPDRWNLFDPDVLRWTLEREFSLPLLRHFTELRMAMEPMAARLAAQRADPAAVADVQASLRRMELGEAAGSELLDADIAFHVAVLRASGNPLMKVFEDVVSAALRMSVRYTSQFPGSAASFLAHAEVAAAIVAHDEERAGRSMQAIIQEVMRLIETAEADSPVQEASGG
jgi:DNA-binding FadR family transcriptional regulator